jgi:uncharacterized membrane protein HdeD (DUF308 family)
VAQPILPAIAGPLGRTLSDDWWVVLVRGIVAVLFGILAFAQPQISLAAVVLWFGFYVLVDGALQCWTAITHRRDIDNWGMLLLSGLVGIGVGIITWVTPRTTALALVFYVAIWAIATGLLELVTAIRLRKEIKGEWALAVSGIAAIVFGILLVIHPGPGAMSLLWLFAVFALIYGAALIALSFRLRSFGRRLVAQFA